MRSSFTKWFKRHTAEIIDVTAILRNIHLISHIMMRKPYVIVGNVLEKENVLADVSHKCILCGEHYT